MKQKNFLKITFLFFFSIPILNAQSAGDIAFVGFNADGDKDFTIVTLADISASSTIYFTDDETTGVGSPSALAGGEGTITWSTGGDIIESGTIIVFTDIDSSSNPNFGASIGSITRSGSFNISTGRDNIIAYTGTLGTPTLYIAGVQIGTPSGGSYEIGPFDGDDITLTNTGLVVGTSLILVDNSASPDGGKYNGSRSNQVSYANYYSEIENNSNWTYTATGNGDLFLPFSQEAFTTSSTTWDGSTDEDWSDADNWSNGVPNIDSNVSIPSTGNNPEVKSGITAVAGNITIDADASLEVTQSLTSKGLTTINSSASNSGTFKVTGTYEGFLVYNRNIVNAFTSWYLISAPVHNYSIVDFATQNSLQLGSGTGTSQNIAMGRFDNSQALVANRWNYYTVGDTDHVTAVTDTTDELNTGQGFSTSLSTAGTITFQGTLQTSDVTRTITLEAGSGGTNFNLVGNPYPSYLNSNTFMVTNSNITTDIWVWSQASGYETKNLASNFQVAPGQGFFIEANSGTSVLLEKASLDHEITNTFQKNANPYIKFSINSEEIKRNAEVYYLNNATKGFDNGYDGKVFGGIPDNFSVFSHLISNSDGTDYAIQSLPNADYENMVIPIGIKSTAGKEITFTAEALNLPSGIKVFLEDRLTNTFTRLDEANTNYTITLTENTNGIGRFYLHTKSSVLNVDDLNLENISIYKTSNSNLRIVGLTQGKSNVKLYNILGKQVLNSSFNSNDIQDIPLPKLASGVYIVQLETGTGILNKKITLE
jgi:hypothetical protein